MAPPAILWPRGGRRSATAGEANTSRSRGVGCHTWECASGHPYSPSPSPPRRRSTPRCSRTSSMARPAPYQRGGPASPASRRHSPQPFEEIVTVPPHVPDNGVEFINHHAKPYCEKEKINEEGNCSHLTAHLPLCNRWRPLWPGLPAHHLRVRRADALARPIPSPSPPNQHPFQPRLPLVLIHDLESHHLAPHRGHKLGPIDLAGVLAADVEDGPLVFGVLRRL